ncbi:hypothetical protein AKJ47_03255 [candidate division MSBL1 archaeon SCGC-AAA261G05]|uniref:YgjP-like metallopeptidase domain-containing protein n=1 Tax=candidate division MSBL1 archaeon SCGC-AAA261G05 TaxID=1698276 RepID=A0A133V8G6_9EURY|nr:hypothetical protein AKJ47_03255 [candidate division MSBL1 archaeon SCGC-AAA261G05]
MGDKAKIDDMNLEYEIVHRNIKYPRLEFKTGNLLLVLPRGYEDQDVIEKHKDWIYEKNNIINSALKEAKDKNLESRDEKDFKDLVHFLVEDFSDELDLEINRVFFRKMKTKWASCSQKRNLTINKLSKYLPGELIKYIILHEMLHLTERKHNEKFWNLISQQFSDYKKKEKELFVYWFLIQNEDL